MIYFINFQQQRLKSHLRALADKKSNCEQNITAHDVKPALTAVNNAYQMFTIKTKSPISSFLSYIPFTPQFNLRLTYSDRLNAAYKTLHAAEKQIKVKTPTATTKQKQVKPAGSEIESLPKVYPSLVSGFPIRVIKQDDAGNGFVSEHVTTCLHR